MGADRRGEERGEVSICVHQPVSQPIEANGKVSVTMMTITMVVAVLGGSFHFAVKTKNQVCLLPWNLLLKAKKKSMGRAWQDMGRV